LKRIWANFIACLGVEVVKSSVHGDIVGVRFFHGSNASFRINWKKRGSNKTIDSVDVWKGGADTTPEHPDFAINTNGLSTVKILPALVKAIKHPKEGKIPLDDDKLAESKAEAKLLMEAIPWEEAFTRLITFLETDIATDGFLFSALYKNGNVTARGAQIFTAIQDMYPEMVEVEKKGARDLYTFVGDVSKIDQDRVLKEINPRHGESLSITAGGQDEFVSDPQMKKLEDQTEKLDLEQALKDLEDLLTGMIKKNLGYAVLVSGRGGIGKTHTVEKVLHNLGLSDGDGYFKITGSATPAAIYRALYEHRDGILLFDDCDSAFDSQEGRNLFKNATDTKKVRKVSWQKASDMYFDPSDMDDEQIEQKVEDGYYPKYFNFEGKIIFISNLNKNKLDPDGALRTRAFLVDVDPTNEDVANFMKKICNTLPLEDGLSLTEEERLEVVDVIVKTGKELNLRKLVRGLNIRAAGMPDWEGLIKRYA
jgi:hypothetical protein